ncbi:MAG: hypothetical protein AAGG48_14980 [Planctomycetota bacterium]
MPARLIERWRRLNGGTPRFAAYPRRQTNRSLSRICNLLPIKDGYGGIFAIEVLGSSKVSASPS